MKKYYIFTRNYDTVIEEFDEDEGKITGKTVKYSWWSIGRFRVTRKKVERVWYWKHR